MRLPLRPVPCLLLLAAAGCAAAGSTASVRTYASTPEFSVRETWSHYTVRGSEARDMALSMTENSPRMDGVPALGLTRWSLSWRFDLRRSSALCRVVSPEVTADVEVVLPRWSPAAPAGGRLIARWQAFRDALVAHEEGHRRLVLEAGREIAARLRRASAPTCALARHRADRAARQIVAEYDRRNRVYDEQTRGGRTQGVSWP